MNSNKIDIEIFIKLTIDYLKKNHMIEIEEDLNIDFKTSHWFRICQKAFKQVDESDILFVKLAWQRNHQEFKSRVLEEINHHLRRNFTHRVKEAEFIDYLNNYTTGNNRNQFNHNFDVVLSKIMNENGINCQVSYNFNHFKKENSRKGKASFWAGQYVCKICSSIFQIKIANKPDKDQDYLIDFECFYEEHENR
jgi:hypothetical protein